MVIRCFFYRFQMLFDLEHVAVPPSHCSPLFRFALSYYRYCHPFSLLIVIILADEAWARQNSITCVKNVRLSKRLVFLYYNELLMNYVYWYYCVRSALQVLKFQKSNFALNTSDFSFCNSMNLPKVE